MSQEALFPTPERTEIDPNQSALLPLSDELIAELELAYHNGEDMSDIEHELDHIADLFSSELF